MVRLKTHKSRVNVALLLLPALVIYIVFQVFPLLAAGYFSVVEWNGIGGSALHFVGFDNYIKAFKSPDFMLSLKNMLKMVFFSVLFHTPIALLLAVAIHSKFKGYRLFKTLFFVPTVFPLTSVGLMWYFVFMPTGALNALFKSIGLTQLVKPWLVLPETAMNSIIFVNIWAGVGYYMVILLAGLTTIPRDLYEASAIDGASKIQQFFHITIPNLRSILAMCIVMDIIGTVKIFDLVFAMTGGGPNGLTNLPTTLMYNEAFKYSHYGVGSAIGMIILIIALILTVGSNRIMRIKED